MPRLNHCIVLLCSQARQPRSFLQFVLLTMFAQGHLAGDNDLGRRRGAEVADEAARDQHLDNRVGLCMMKKTWLPRPA